VKHWPCRGHRPWIYGHRGVRGIVPENTLLAFERALELGADGVELDVQISREGVAVVFHDSTLERMTAGADARRISEVSADEICSTPLGQGASIPRLRDVLNWACHREVFLNIELKSGEVDAERILDAVERDVLRGASTSPQARLLFSSFAMEIVRSARRRGWPWPLARLVGPDDGFPREEEMPAGTGLHAHYGLLDDSTVARWQPSQAFLNAWTVNSPDIAVRLALAGIDGIISDDPAAIRNAVEQAPRV
jgi:glycerophosphoryl diester phosphodiesterase